MTQKITQKNARLVLRVCRILGGQKNAAVYLGKGQASISRYINQRTPVPKTVVMVCEDVIQQAARG